MRLRERVSADLPQVEALLARVGLPTEGLERTQGWVLDTEGRLVGHVALEPAGSAVVLRSLGVDPDFRGQRLGERLMAAAEKAAGDRLPVLKTDTVGPWMLRRGYREVRLDEVPADVRATTQFEGTLCAGTPVYVKDGSPAKDAIKDAVRQRYGGFVTQRTSCCGAPKGGGLEDPSLKVGYALHEVEAVPEGANLGLGCGNPVALASLKPGEVVLDLGSGAGFDAFLAAQRVGPTGQVIGVDMTPEMLARARELADRHGYTQVSFREGDIEQLPVADASVDVVISNCVINLTTDKAQAFREAFRVLKPGGRLMVSDLVLLRPLPAALREDMDAYAACISGALLKDDYLAAIRSAGFEPVTVVGESGYDLGEPELAQVASGLCCGGGAGRADLREAAQAVVSVRVQGLKPGR